MIGLPEDSRDLVVELADAGADFAAYEGVIQIGLPPRRIDILNRATGITFDEAVREGASFELEGRRVPVIGLDALLRNKRAAGREQDLADAEFLERSRDR